MALFLGLVHNVTGLLLDDHLLRVHLMLRQVLHLDGVEVAQAAVQGDIGKVDALDLHALHQLTTEVQAC